MRRQESKLDRKKMLMWVALGAFLVEVCTVVIGNTLLGHGWHIEYTISRYVGLEAWSAIMFALGNFVVAITTLYYLYGVGEDLKARRGFFWLVVVIMMSLIGLSMCPLGYFDSSGAVSTISWLHQIFSRTMFAVMLTIVVWVLCCNRAAPMTRLTAAVFVIYGIVYVSAYLTDALWMERCAFIYESLYLFGFMVWCLGCKVIKERSEDGAE